MDGISWAKRQKVQGKASKNALGWPNHPDEVPPWHRLVDWVCSCRGRWLLWSLLTRVPIVVECLSLQVPIQTMTILSGVARVPNQKCANVNNAGTLLGLAKSCRREPGLEAANS